MRIVGQDNRNPGFTSKFRHRFADFNLLLQTVIHHFEEVISLAHDLFKFERSAGGFIKFILKQKRLWNAADAGGHRNNSFAVLCQKFTVNSRLAPESFDVSKGRKLD